MTSKGASGLDPVVRRTLGDHGGLVRASQLFDAGVHPRTLYGLRNAGQLEQVAHGLYRAASAPLPPHFDLLVVAKRASHAAICLISALAFHELTDEIPHEVSIAIPRGSTSPRIESPPIRVFHYARDTFSLGLEHRKIAGIDLKVYSPTRSIVDAFRFRNRIGEDVAIKALANGLRARRVRPGPLLELASKLRARATIEPYLKALTA
jgi:predicted transcriptional regulator of viral defense system